MNKQRSAALAVAAMVAALVLTGCGEGTAASTPSGSTTPSSTSSATAPPPSTSPSASTPSPSPSAAVKTVAIPTDCHALVNAQTYASTFGATPLNATGVVNPGEAGALTPHNPPAGASIEQALKSAIQLRCVWRDPGADTTYLEATVATVDPALAATYLDTLSTSGYGCKDANGGRQCQRVTKNTQYPVDDAHTALLRGSVFIEVSQSNFSTNNLMGSIATTIFG